jgi:hypothetical protein
MTDAMLSTFKGVTKGYLALVLVALSILSTGFAYKNLTFNDTTNSSLASQSFNLCEHVVNIDRGTIELSSKKTHNFFVIFKEMAGAPLTISGSGFSPSSTKCAANPILTAFSTSVTK